MGIEMKLNAGAVRALIQDDEGFRLELQRCVVAEIVSKTLGGDIDQKSRDLIFSEVGKATDDLHRRTAEQLRSEAAILEIIKSRTETEFKNAISRGQNDAEGFIGSSLKEAVEARLTSLVRKVIEGNVKSIEETIKSLIDNRIDKVLCGMEERWKTEMERQIRRDVMARLQGAMR
ncbi:hypothetical protein KUV57_11080 [Epibacterium sp. DP7N7-1]|nr:hypothetical protein [Epibacterium sp. DP7N7-1]